MRPIFRSTSRGFTLIELMIVVAIVAILAAVALPSYRDYILRGQLVDATSLLSSSRANMERYFQDNRTYATVGSIVPPCSGTQGLFTLSCPSAPTATAYTLQATGIGAVAAFAYTVDNLNRQQTAIGAGAPPGWATPSPNTCWLVKKGQVC